MASDLKIKRVGMVVNRKREGSLELLSKLRQWCGPRGIDVLDTDSLSVSEILEKVQLVVCAGGDGTLLSVADHMRERSIPLLGVNLGSLGFLTEVKESEMLEELENCLKGTSQIEDRLMLSCMASSQVTGVKRQFVALNDVVISREGLSRILCLQVCVEGEKLTNFTGDGVIVATPTGSTAYSLSAGGAVVHPKLGAMIITPICPHASSLRPLVVSCRERVSVQLMSNRGETKALLTLDGQENLEIDDSFTVEITHSKIPLRLVKSSKRSYFATLREKFKFPE